MDYEITANEDDSVTLKAGSITAHISGDNFKDANWAAMYLGQFITMSYDLSALALLVRHLKTSASTLNLNVSDLSNMVEDMNERITKCQK